VSLPFYFDHHVPMAICDALRSRGIDVLTTLDDGSTEWDDDAILQRATELGRLVFTQDRDFLVIANRWASQGLKFAGVVFAHQLQVTIGQAVNELELIAVVLEAHEMQDRVEYLPLK
jgi:predicted nuclease of predicted toxin-antitoxin system